MNNNNEEKKKSKIKELYYTYKEAKRDPRKKAGMKLLGYFIFFFILLLMASITNNMPKTNSKKNITNTTTKVVDKYVEKQNKLLTNKYNVNYEIKYNNIDYKISGTIENSVVNGYLEQSEGITKISIKNNQLYEIANNIENILLVDYNVNYLNIEYIFNIIRKTSAFIQDVDKEKTYLYEIKDGENITKIYIKTNEEQILTIKIEELQNSYLLNFDK